MTMSDEETPKAKPDPGALRLKKRESSAETESSPATAAPPRKSRSAKKNREKKRRKKGTVSPGRMLFNTLGSCAVALILLGLFLAHQVLEWDLVPKETALLGRNIFLAVFLLVVIVESFSEDLLQGILCLFLLPYTVFYAVFVSETGPIRGFTIALLLFFAAEMVFTPEEAVVPKVEAEVSGWIKAGQDKLIYPDGRPQAGFE